MFERFTDRARSVVVLAQEESRLLGHNHIGTEHLLLGLLAEREGVAARALESLGVTLDAARHLVREIVGPGSEAPRGHIPFTQRAKKILELSLREALSLGSEVISTEHLLLGLTDVVDGVGAQILERLGAQNTKVRKAVIGLASAEPETEAEAEAAEPEAEVVRSFASNMRIRIEALAEVKDLLVNIDRRLSAIERHLGIGDGPEEPPAAAGE
jgi:ATP-dependent Clp protease ATP-binding subunit ClpC